METSTKDIWFERKQYGWGWYPATWQGWLVLAVWALFFATGVVLFTEYVSIHPEPEWGVVALYLLYVVLITSVLIWISYKKGETPRWQWGSKK